MAVLLPLSASGVLHAQSGEQVNPPVAMPQMAVLKGSQITSDNFKDTKRLQLPRTPEDFFPIMEARFNSLDVEAALELFHQNSIMIDAAGQVHRGVAEIGSELKRYFGTGLQLNLTPRHLFVTADTALSINDWSYDGVAKDGTRIRMNGTTSDVLRRCGDGVWRYFIDNPFGTQTGVKVTKNAVNK